jgi:hypothetical protein
MNDYEQAVRAFEEADKVYKDLLTRFEDGSIILEVWDAASAEKTYSRYIAATTDLERRREDRNAKQQAASNALRAACLIPDTEWRGPEAKSAIIKCGPFTASSVTKRTFHIDTLFEHCKKKGVLERLLGLKGIGKDGQEYNFVRQTWQIDYDGVKTWLKQNGLDDVVTAAYDEKESTPQVKGPKPVATLGEEIK